MRSSSGLKLYVASWWEEEVLKTEKVTPQYLPSRLSNVLSNVYWISSSIFEYSAREECGTSTDKI